MLIELCDWFLSLYLSYPFTFTVITILLWYMLARWIVNIVSKHYKFVEKSWNGVVFVESED